MRPFRGICLHTIFTPRVYTTCLHPLFTPRVYIQCLYPVFAHRVYNTCLHPVLKPHVYTSYLYPVFIPCDALWLHLAFTAFVYTLRLHPVFTPCFYNLYRFFTSCIQAPCRGGRDLCCQRGRSSTLSITPVNVVKLKKVGE